MSFWTPFGSTCPKAAKSLPPHFFKKETEVFQLRHQEILHNLLIGAKLLVETLERTGKANGGVVGEEIVKLTEYVHLKEDKRKSETFFIIHF